MKSWKIGNTQIKNQIVLAPMAGISNAAYFKICEEMGIGYVVTELISSEAIVRNNKKTFDMLNGIESINIPVAIQIFGNNPDVLAEAAKRINELYPGKIIDINMGCPVPKVAVKAKSGSALLKDIDLIKRIVTAVVNAVPVSVTVKIRSGWDEKSINAVAVAKAVEEAGASAIAVHARTRSQGYGGKADLDIIKAVKMNVSIPVIGNGDVRTAEDFYHMLEYTGCDAVMIGRGLLGNPWLIKTIIDDNFEVQKQDRINMIKKHLKLLKTYKSERLALLEIRSNAIWYLKGLPNTSLLKQNICKSKSEKELIEYLDEYLSNN